MTYNYTEVLLYEESSATSWRALVETISYSFLVVAATIASCCMHLHGALRTAYTKQWHWAM
jgi:hypothetical protein